MSTLSKPVGPILVLLAVSLFGQLAQAKYSGGTGEPNDPYQIATAADLIALGEEPNDYDKHFIMTADIDLDPNLPGRKVFDRAVIAPGEYDSYTEYFRGIPFTGVFDGDGHRISHLTINGKDYVGLFGQLYSGAEVRNLRVVDVNIIGSGSCVGGLAGGNNGSLIQCYTTGVVSGGADVGGLVGENYDGTVTQCYSTGSVSATGGYVGGLVGGNDGTVTQCYGTGAVTGSWEAGGLVGHNWGGIVTQCYSTGSVSHTGGYVSGAGGYVGGLLGSNHGGLVTACFWDTQTSSVSESAAGVGLTTVEMMDPYMLGLNGFAGDPNWVLDAGHDYPRLAWEGKPGRIIPQPHVDWLQGHGTVEDPYRIDTAEQLIFLGRAGALCNGCFFLAADIDLDPSLPGRRLFRTAVIPVFTGLFDGGGHVISHLTIKGGGNLGLFGFLFGAEVKNVGVVDVNVSAPGGYVGGLVGENHGTVAECHSTGTVSGDDAVGGLVGYNSGTVTQGYSTGVLNGSDSVGGLVGVNNGGAVTQCYSAGTVSAMGGEVGGLVGLNAGSVTQCYSTGAVSSYWFVGGLVGHNWYGTLTQCYSTGLVVGTHLIGGLVGSNNWSRPMNGCFWDTETSGQATSDGGTGKTTAQMQAAKTFLDAGWDFVGPVDGPSDIWAMPQGGGYPILWWQLSPWPPLPTFSGGTGEPNNPYLISTPQDLNSIGRNPRLLTCHFRLVADLDLRGLSFHPIGSADDPYAGVFDGGGHTISHLTIRGGGYLGLFARLCRGAGVRKLGLVDASITASGDYVGGLAGRNEGTVTQCYSTGVVKGGYYVGGLVGKNIHVVTDCYNNGTVSGTGSWVGGLVGESYGTVNQCYSTGSVSGGSSVGGLVGNAGGTMTACFYDTQTSGQTKSAGGTGKTTAEMQTAKTFLDAGWDFVGETANGAEDIWRIDEGKGYPRLWWEAPGN